MSCSKRLKSDILGGHGYSQVNPFMGALAPNFKLNTEYFKPEQASP